MSDHSRQNILNEVFGDRASSGLAAFVQTARMGSFAKAAERMGGTPSGVAKAVQRMERRLGTTLFARTTRKLSLTESGLLLLEHADRILDAIAQAEASLAQADAGPRGRLKVSLAPGIGRALVLPSLRAFMQAYPEILLDIDFDSRQVDVVAEGYDLVLRGGVAPPDSGLRGRSLGTERSLLCASPDYLRERGVPASPAALADHRCIRYRSPTTGRIRPWPLPPTSSGCGVEVPQTIVLGDPEAVRLSALAGIGIASLARYAALRAFADGSLQPVLAEVLSPQDETENWLLWPPDRQHLPKVRAFVEHVVAVFDAHRGEDTAIGAGAKPRRARRR
ncbi:LysR family transcriptional regulator [Luteimonas aquatica]|uniref:LysR family transcriptional regulator n=1 Tax=Luteimonas aquatica TaxID=450364 RepID=UPI001F58282C|nr:LysR family transcriptional regulator [Luteimonas aquatica]